MKEKVSKATLASYEADRKIRKDWGAIKPVTRVIGDKRRKDPKHKGRQFDW